MPKHPVDASILDGYARAIHDVLNDQDANLEMALSEYGVSPFQAKLIDGFIIQHSRWIYERMREEFDNLWRKD